MSGGCSADSLFVPGETVFPEIPDKPTREQAEAALALLKRPLAAFPFAEVDSDRYREFISPVAQIRNQSPELRDC